MIQWGEDGRFTIGCREFVSVLGIAPPAGDVWPVLKPRATIDHHAALVASLAPQCIVEIGTYRGGSAAMLAALCPDAVVTTIDLGERADALDSTPNVRAYHHTDASDPGLLATIVAGPIDLVIDDGCHRTEPTRASFNYLYPRLRPGGAYIVEDWRYEPLRAFACELLTRYADDEFPSLKVERHSIVVTR